MVVARKRKPKTSTSSLGDIPRRVCMAKGKNKEKGKDTVKNK
jgi:hypothetical protein